MAVYDVIIFTNRNYGFYSAYALSILGLKVCVLNIRGYRENKMSMEPNIWPNEQREDYLHILRSMNVPISEVNYKDLFYSYGTNNWKVSFFNSSEIFYSENMLFALSKNHILGGTKVVTIDNLQFKNGLYMIGENAIYGDKHNEGDVYTGEANLVAQQIYKKIHKSKENITVHSTDKIFT